MDYKRMIIEMIENVKGESTLRFIYYVIKGYLKNRG